MASRRCAEVSFGRLALDRDWRDELDEWLAPFVTALRHKKRGRTCPAYTTGTEVATNDGSVDEPAPDDVLEDERSAIPA